MASAYDKASLVMLPHAYKDDKLYSVKPEDRSGDFTFSRDGAGASPATRVNASGLIEKGRENVLLQSNQFDTTWATSSASVTGGQTGYDGSNNAWLLNATGNGGRITITSSVDGVYTYSVYAKAGSINWILVYAHSSAGSDFYGYFDLSGSGALGSVANTIETKIESVGNGWFRCSIVFATTATLTNSRIYPANGDGDVSGSGNIYIQDAQLEQGLVATDYIETTTAPVSAGLLGDMPRLDYSGGATCPSLLLEPSRVNIVDDSEYVTGYFNQSSAVVSYNEIISPEGVQNAFKLTSTTNGQARIEKSRPVGGTDTYTLSVFLKAGNSNFASLANFNRNASVRFNLSDGTIQGSGNVVDADIIPMGNGWYRCYMVMQEQASQTANIYKILVSSDGETYFANNGDYIYGYGAQLELGSYPTSYIPTYGSASTRNGEIMNTPSTALNGGQVGTFFIEFERKGIDSSNTGALLEVKTSGANEELRLHFDAPSAQVRWRDANNSYADIGGNISTPTNTTKKVLLVSNGTTAKAFADGAQIGSDYTIVSAFDFDNMLIRQRGGVDVKQFIYFTTALTDAECIALTTL